MSGRQEPKAAVMLKGVRQTTEGGRTSGCDGGTVCSPWGVAVERAGDSGRELGGVLGWDCRCESDPYLGGGCD